MIRRDSPFLEGKGSEGQVVQSLFDTIRTKRDTRSYAPTPIPDETLTRILQVGRMAGSAKHAQPCRFVVLTDPDHKRELAACGDFTPHLPSAPVLVAVVLMPPEAQFDPVRATAFDAGPAAENMMLAAWSEGITSCPTTMHRGDDAARVLRLPEGHHVIWVIGFGFPAETPAARPSRPRLPLSEYVHHEYWSG